MGFFDFLSWFDKNRPGEPVAPSRCPVCNGKTQHVCDGESGVLLSVICPRCGWERELNPASSPDNVTCPSCDHELVGRGPDGNLKPLTSQDVGKDFGKITCACGWTGKWSLYGKVWR